jgi:predicted anti-sigma-YlaC factor YlaD
MAAGSLAWFASGCSARKYAINKLGDALSKSSSGFASDDDPDLIKDAAPFSLKLIESLLAESPEHKGMLAAAASGFTQYAYAFVQQDADEMEAKDLAASQQLRARAKRLFIRARNHGLHGLAVKRPGFEDALRQDPKTAVTRCDKAEVPLLYWTAAAWASVISLSKDNPETIADLPIVEALIDRALALDESYGDGAIHSFLITYELSRPSGVGDPVARSRQHYERALALAGGHQAGPLVNWAENICVQKQDLAGFKTLLDRALAVDVNARPDWRLVNLVMQRRARWLLSRVDELFLVAEPAPEPAK